MPRRAVGCAGVQYKLPLKNVGGFGLSPAADTSMLKLAAWVPEGKGAPGFVGIWDVTSLGKSQDAPAPIARRSFFRVGFMPLGLSSCSKALPLASMCSSETAAKLPRESKCTMRNIAELRSYVCVCDVLSGSTTLSCRQTVCDCTGTQLEQHYWPSQLLMLMSPIRATTGSRRFITWLLTAPTIA